MLRSTAERGRRIPPPPCGPVSVPRLAVNLGPCLTRGRDAHGPGPESPRRTPSAWVASWGRSRAARSWESRAERLCRQRPRAKTTPAWGLSPPGRPRPGCGCPRGSCTHSAPSLPGAGAPARAAGPRGGVAPSPLPCRWNRPSADHAGGLGYTSAVVCRTDQTWPQDPGILTAPPGSGRRQAGLSTPGPRPPQGTELIRGW